MEREDSRTSSPQGPRILRTFPKSAPRSPLLDAPAGEARGEPLVRTTLGRDLRLATAALESTNQAAAITDSALRILASNRAFQVITGFSALELAGQHPRLFESGRHDQAFYDSLATALLGSGRCKGEIWIRRKDGEVAEKSLSACAVRDEQGRVENYVATLSDRHAHLENDARFDRLSHYDPVTGLPNRLLFNARGMHALGRSREAGGRVALFCLSLNLERFEHLDDTIGLPAGDGLLRRVAERVAACVGAADTVGHFRGDEFAILLEEPSDAASAGAVARRILDVLAFPFSVGGHELFVSAAIGISLFPDDGDDLSGLMRQATSAMHRARERPHDRVEFYTAQITRTAAERFRLESDLRRALRGDPEGELELHYQPQVSVRTGEIVGVEALVRWRHPELGLLPPSRFVPLAEQSGLVEGIGAWVLRTACRQASDWIHDGLPPLRVAVNLSAQEISSSPLADRIAAVLLETGLAPDRLEIEITESTLMTNLDEAVRVLESVKALGVTIALDDFGTGYSSLNYLRRLPIDRLKLDGSFICQIAHDKTAQAITRAAIELGHGLQAELVAEGVEQREQLDFLRTSGCDSYQGHLFSAALPPAELLSLLRTAPTCRPRADAASGKSDDR